MTTEDGYLGKKYGALVEGDGVYGDAIIDDSERKAPYSVLPILLGDGLVATPDADGNRTFAVYVALRALSGRLTTGGASPNFGWSKANPPSGSSLTGGAAQIDIGGAPKLVELLHINFDTATNVLEVGLSIAANERSAFTREEFAVIDSSGARRAFKLSDATVATASFGTYANRTRYSWTATELWTDNIANVAWSITAPIGPLNYLPHITSAQNGDVMQAIANAPGWAALAPSHIPDSVTKRLDLIYDHMGGGYGAHRVGYILYAKDENASLAAAFPPADFDAPAFGIVESEDGSLWDVGALREDETSSTAATNRNRVLITTAVAAAAGRLDFDGSFTASDDDYLDAVASVTVESFVDSGDDGNGYTDFRVAIDPTVFDGIAANVTPASLYVQLTGITGTLTLPRLTGDLAYEEGVGGKRYPSYGIEYTAGENNAQSMLWFGRMQALLRAVEANSDQLEIKFFLNAAGTQALNIKPTHIRTVGTRAWESIKPPTLPSWVTDPDEEIPTSKVRYIGITSLADNAVGPGIAVTSLTGNHASAFQLLSPTFDLDDEDNQAGLLEFEIRRAMTNPSPANLGYGSGNDATATIFSRVRVRDLRGSTAYSATQENGVLIGKSDVMAGSVKVGEERTYVAKNVTENEVGVYTRYAFESGHSTAGSYNGGLRVDGDFLHNEAPPQAAAVAPRADEISIRYPAAGNASVTLTAAAATTGLFTMDILGAVKSISGATFMGISTAGAGTDYFTLPAGFYAIDIHSQFTNGATGGGSRATPEVYLERSSDGGSVWTEIPESRQGGYKKAGGENNYQSRDTIHFTSTCHLAAAADERFRVRYSRYYQAENSTQSENIEGQVTAVKFS